ncbi:hypothetical protein BD410DRAFT_809987 [Rickenella mellea]|uniref:Uncharacterized protein n=1 Tax=Rickenella mellea TaxID=50990 RepID=A0A4Y7PGC3_9AGAM|nr:hypothetical protein BD410DRAFT_809987 [Rickenella mellea]
MSDSQELDYGAVAVKVLSTGCSVPQEHPSSPRTLRSVGNDSRSRSERDCTARDANTQRTRRNHRAALEDANRRRWPAMRAKTRRRRASITTHHANSTATDGSAGEWAVSGRRQQRENTKALQLAAACASAVKITICGGGELAGWRLPPPLALVFGRAGRLCGRERTASNT